MLLLLVDTHSRRIRPPTVCLSHALPHTPRSSAAYSISRFSVVASSHCDMLWSSPWPSLSGCSMYESFFRSDLPINFLLPRRMNQLSTITVAETVPQVEKFLDSGRPFQRAYVPVRLSIHTYTQPNLAKRKRDTLSSVDTYYVCRHNVGTAKSFRKVFTVTLTFTVHRPLVHVHVFLRFRLRPGTMCRS